MLICCLKRIAWHAVSPVAAGETDIEGGMDSDASEFFGEGFDPQAALQQMGEGAQDGSGAQPFQVMGLLLVPQWHVARGLAAGLACARSGLRV